MGGWGIHATNGNGTVINHGAISGGQFGIFHTAGSEMSGELATYNDGSVDGGSFAYLGGGALVERVYNAGTMTGNVGLGSGVGSVFDSSQGYVYGTIYGSSLSGGGQTSIGGLNGGDGSNRLTATQATKPCSPSPPPA